MKVRLSTRLKAFTRALIWLVDEAGGEAPVVKVADTILGMRRGGPNLNMLWRLVAHGWAEVTEGKDGRVMTGRVKVTAAGALWRDYLKYEVGYQNMGRDEMHGRIRALELALEPFAKVGQRYKTGDTIAGLVAEGLGISPLQLELAAEVLWPQPDGKGISVPANGT